MNMESYHYLMAQVGIDYPLFQLALKSHRNTRGSPMTFVDKPYLVELYTDFPKITGADVMKGVQTGLSELLIQLVLERSGWQGRITAYVLPTFTIRDRFVQNRINPLLDTIPEYRVRSGGGKGSKGNLKLKRFGKGAMMFLGSNTVSDFIEFSADVLVIDEFDQCDPKNLAKARDRLRASPHPQLFRIGNPTMPRTGVARLYEHSDGRRWYSRCNLCNHWQCIDWFEHIIERSDNGAWEPRDKSRIGTNEDLRPICSKCRKPFDRTARTGAWVAERPENDRRGYKISRLDVLSEKYTNLFQEWQSSQGHSDLLSTFYTSVLGQPFEFSGSRVTMEMLHDAATSYDNDYGGGSEYKGLTVTMGVDVGSLLHVNISTIDETPDGEICRTARFVGAVRTFAEVEDLIRRYYVDCCVIDAMPETRKSQELRDSVMREGSCEVWLCRFHPTPRVGRQVYGLKLNHRDRVVTVDRTQVFDATFEDIKEGRRIFPSDVFSALGWAQQMRAAVRVLNEERGRIIWTEGNSPDHYRLCGIYDRIAYDVSDLGGGYFSA